MASEVRLGGQVHLHLHVDRLLHGRRRLLPVPAGKSDFEEGSKVLSKMNKNEYFSRPAAQGGLHRDSQGSSLKDGFTVFLISELCTFYEAKKSSNKKAFLAKKFRFGLKVNP